MILSKHVDNKKCAPKKTFFHYFQHGWNSFSAGQYVSAISPQTFGDRDPIAETRYKLYRGNDEEKQMASKIIRSEKWLVNVYVVNDPVNPDNNGKVMTLRYGKQLHKVIASAIDGEDASDLGPRIFDLSPNGVNFKVIVEGLKVGDSATIIMQKSAERLLKKYAKKVDQSPVELNFNLDNGKWALKTDATGYTFPTSKTITSPELSSG